VSADLGAASDELYGLLASEFTAARDRLAAGARQAGDRDLAAAIKKLRRPSASAWVANRLVRQRPDQVAELLQLGAALRHAQAQLAGDDLRRLTQEGQRGVTALSREAGRLAGDSGQSLSEAGRRELEDTFKAALADPEAGEALRSGRLTTALHYSGFGMVDAPAAVGPGPPPRHPPSPPSAAATATALRDAQAELASAQKDAADHQRTVDQAHQLQERLQQRIRELTQELEQVRAEEQDAATALGEAARALRRVTRAVEIAAARVERAEGGLDRHAR
jgi:hypothetical protein